jgi:hypothetical protein
VHDRALLSGLTSGQYAFYFIWQAGSRKDLGVGKPVAGDYNHSAVWMKVGAMTAARALVCDTIFLEGADEPARVDGGTAR